MFLMRNNNSCQVSAEVSYFESVGRALGTGPWAFARQGCGGAPVQTAGHL